MEGRTAVEFDMMARTTRGAPWPEEGERLRYPGNVVLMGREPCSDLYQSLREVGVDLDRAVVSGKKLSPPNLPALDRLILKMGEVSLIVANNWFPYCDSVAFQENQSIRIIREHIAKIDEWSRDRGVLVVLDICIWARVWGLQRTQEAIRHMLPRGMTVPFHFIDNHGCMPFRVMTSIDRDGAMQPEIWFHHKPPPWVISWWHPSPTRDDPAELMAENIPPLPE